MCECGGRRTLRPCGIMQSQMPPVECLFKGESDGRLKATLAEHVRCRKFPAWFSVACSPRGSYREDDIVDFLNKHLEEWKHRVRVFEGHPRAVTHRQALATRPWQAPRQTLAAGEARAGVRGERDRQHERGGAARWWYGLARDPARASLAARPGTSMPSE